MSLEMQQRIRENAQELGNFLSDLNKWETDIKREDDELKKAAEIEEVILSFICFVIMMPGSIPNLLEAVQCAQKFDVAART